MMSRVARRTNIAVGEGKALLRRTDVGLRATSTPVQVPDNHTARLMYYLNSVCALLDLSDQTNLARLRDFQNYNRLSEEETDALIALCLLISPDELIGKVIFPNNAMCGDSLNKHYELSAVRSSLLVSESVVIGGTVRSVTKIMTYKEPWIVNNWIRPMEHFRPRLQHMLSESGNNGCCCTIL